VAGRRGTTAGASLPGESGHGPPAPRGETLVDTVIETRALRKEFRSRRGQLRVAVAGLDLSVPEGGVHGFLGPNGSGKTTTIRMLLGLASATSGTMRLFGTEVPDRLPSVIDRIGAVVEMPKFLPNFTGRQNLALLARTRDIAPARIDAALETVGLSGRDKDRYKGYSLGMKQRLAIAATLLKEPRLLILDEPTNGLDPSGIREIRGTITDLGEQGVTVLLSSHILAEVQQVCDGVTIIGNGRMLASGRVDDLLGGSSGHRVVVADPVRAAAVLDRAGLTATPDGEALRVETERSPEDISRALGAEEIWVRELTPLRTDLETVFLQLTEGEALGGSAPAAAGEDA
jgi:ABC-2 type transport system ATP-binding protein